MGDGGALKTYERSEPTAAAELAYRLQWVQLSDAPARLMIAPTKAASGKSIDSEAQRLWREHGSSSRANAAHVINRAYRHRLMVIHLIYDMRKW